jgi:signal transduction histidine kinase
VILLGALLRNRYVASLQREQETREDLERQVRERTAQLEANFAALRESEAQRMAVLERERLLQEMHDGLGSQLLLAKMNAQRGHLSRDAMVKTCDDCIQEMRLAVDGLSVADGDLGLLLANLRHRFGARIGEAGLALEWNVGDTPLVPSLRGTGGPDLVRIVQEAINNVMHHAKATRIRLDTECEGDAAVVVTITDDGIGMPLEASEGRGLRNIRSRAARLGATVEWRAGERGGTELRLTLPLAEPRAVSAT